MKINCDKKGCDLEGKIIYCKNKNNFPSIKCPYYLIASTKQNGLMMEDLELPNNEIIENKYIGSMI